LTDFTAIIADDEEPSRNHLKSMLTEVWPELIICGEAENGVKALKLIKTVRPNIAFLDIKMPGLSGMQVAKEILGICRIVFITAYDQYAVEAFDNEAIDYILKPASTERLKKTVERIKSQLVISRKSQAHTLKILEKIMTGIETTKTKYLRWIKIKNRGVIKIIPIDNIYYFKSENKYTSVVTKNQEFLIRTSINELAEKLNPEFFWQIHRSTIINANMIDSISTSMTGRGLVKLKMRSELHTISRKYAHIFKQM